jgi:hypothetical protein
MIKKYNNFIKEKNDDDLPSYMSDDLDYDYSNDEYSEEDYSEEDSEENEEMDNLVYWIRALFSNSGIKAEVEVDKLDISIYCTLNKKSSLKEIINILDVSKKLSKDILPQYSSKMTMFETKKGERIMVFDFYYKKLDEDDDKLPFD